MREGIPEWMVSCSVWLNHMTGGPVGWSLCARIYDNSLEGEPYAALCVKVIDKVLFFDPQHCRKAWLLRSKE